MRGFQIIVTLCCLAGVLLVPGCGKNQGEKTQVRGTVTVGGKPLKGKGYSLRFTRTGAAATTIAVSDDGSFSGEAITGENSIELMAGASGHGDNAKKTPDYSVSTYTVLQKTVNKDDTLTLDFTPASGTTPSGGH